MHENDATLKSSWTNGIIWAAIMAVLAVALRYILWYNKIWMGDTDVFSDAFCTNSMALLCVTVLIPVILSLISYKGYMNLAAHNPSKLHLVAQGAFGRPWILALILTLVLEVIWNVVCVVILVIACSLDLAYAEDMTVIMTFCAINGVGLAVDVVLFLVGNYFFKPNTVMGYRN